MVGWTSGNPGAESRFVLLHGGQQLGTFLGTHMLAPTQGRKRAVVTGGHGDIGGQYTVCMSDAFCRRFQRANVVPVQVTQHGVQRAGHGNRGPVADVAVLAQGRLPVETGVHQTGRLGGVAAQSDDTRLVQRCHREHGLLAAGKAGSHVGINLGTHLVQRYASPERVGACHA